MLIQRIRNRNTVFKLYASISLNTGILCVYSVNNAIPSSLFWFKGPDKFICIRYALLPVLPTLIQRFSGHSHTKFFWKIHSAAIIQKSSNLWIGIQMFFIRYIFKKAHRER
jgi:hypothetical protein